MKFWISVLSPGGLALTYLATEHGFQDPCQVKSAVISKRLIQSPIFSHDANRSDERHGIAVGEGRGLGLVSEVIFNKFTA